MDEIVKIVAKLDSTHRYYCDECKDTGKIEVVKYTGKKDLQYVKPNQEVIGYDRLHRLIWNWVKSVTPGLPEIGKFNWEDTKTVELYQKAVKDWDPFTCIETVKTDPCKCPRGKWTKEKKDEFRN